MSKKMEDDQSLSGHTNQTSSFKHKIKTFWCEIIGHQFIIDAIKSDPKRNVTCYKSCDRCGKKFKEHY